MPFRGTAQQREKVLRILELGNEVDACPLTAKSAGICWTSPSTRDCGSNSTITRASRRRRMSACSSVLPGQSPPTALRCMPGSIISGVRIVALRLSAVTVVTMSAPRTASAIELQRRTRSPGSCSFLRLRSSFAVADRSTSYNLSSRIPSS
jgi:hypothetical protein